MFLRAVSLDPARFPRRDRYPFNLPLLREPLELTLSRPVAFFVGENGSGKSTVLEAIVRRCDIHIWQKPKRHIAHHNPDEATLWRYLNVAWVNGPVPGGLFSAETFAEIADFLDDVALVDEGQLKYFGGHLINTLSHGEGMMSYFRGRYRFRGLYFMDEPEAALSPATQVKLLQLLHSLQSEGHAQFIIATHSPILLALPGAQILSFDSDRVQETTYEQTAHYRLYKAFLDNPGAFLNGHR